MNKLFESLDEKVFTEELKQDLLEQFNSAVDTKAEALAEVKAVEIVADKVEEKVVELEEKAEEFKKILEEEAKEESNKLLDQVDAYLEKVVDDFVSEAKDALDSDINNERSDMIIEAMDAMLVATGVEIAKITEAKDSTDADLKLKESTKKYDELFEANIELEKENLKLMKMGIIAEMKEELSVLDAAKFEKLANLVEFEKSENYVNKLEVILENINKTEVTEEIEESTKQLDESTKQKQKDEKIVTSFSHLI